MPQKITAFGLWAEKCYKRSRHSVCRPRNATKDHSLRSVGREMPQEITAFGLQAEKCHKRSQHSVCGPRIATRDHSSRLWAEKCHKRSQHSVCRPRNVTRDHSIRSVGRELPQMVTVAGLQVCVLLEQEGLTRGPPECVMRSAAKFVNYVYTYSEKLRYDFDD